MKGFAIVMGFMGLCCLLIGLQQLNDIPNTLSEVELKHLPLMMMVTTSYLLPGYTLLMVGIIGTFIADARDEIIKKLRPEGKKEEV